MGRMGRFERLGISFNIVVHVWHWRRLSLVFTSPEIAGRVTKLMTGERRGGQLRDDRQL